jgi:hypothetical protein
LFDPNKPDEDDPKENYLLMKHRFTLSLLLALAVVACASAAFAQDEADTMPAKPMYGHLKPHLTNDASVPAAKALTTWNGTFTYLSKTYKYNMVGTAPSTGTSTTIPSFIIPVKLSYVTSKGTTTFTPETKLSNGVTAVQNTVNSPIFQSGIDFTSNGVDLGTTQYVDAFQRANFWGTVSSETGYHVLLGTPKVLPVLALTVPTADGNVGTEFGVRVGLASIDWFDEQLQAYIKAHTQIVPNSLPIFITYDTYLTEGGCCIGGYHNSMGTTGSPQAYAMFTYINKVGTFAQDVSALSHETAEWMDDPLVVNTSGNTVECGILEVGDPEEGETNYGAFPYTLGGFTYNLQDLVFLEYFGAPNTTSAGGSLSFQGNPFNLTVCSNGG